MFILLTSQVHGTLLLNTTLYLAAGRQRLAQVGPHRQPKLIFGVFLRDLSLQLIALILVKAVKRGEGQGLLIQEASQASLPTLQHLSPQHF